MAWDVRPTKDLAEFRDALGAIFHYFGGGPDDAGAKRFEKVLPLERMQAAFDGDRVVGGAGTFPFELTVPGGPVACGGVTVVGVLPTYRRRGVLTAMMRAQLDDIRNCGESIAALWASEEEIYRRFGFGMASFAGEIELPSGYTGLRQAPDESARSRLITLDEAKSVVPDIYDRVRAKTPGMFDRTELWWELRVLDDPPDRRYGGGEKNVLLLELGGEPAGYALYRVFTKFEHGSSTGHVAVIEALADGAIASRELWRVLLDMDWLATLKASLLPVDHPLLHQLRYPRRLQMRLGDGLWVRLVDVGAALSARAYGSEEPVVFEVEDAFLPENAGRWKLSGGKAERTDEAADLALDVGELGAVYLGGFTFAELLRAGLVRELKDGGAARGDAVFRTDWPKPWCPEIF